MEWMLLPLKRYADFGGRSSRREYWMFALLHATIGLLLYVPIIGALLAAPTNEPPTMLGVVLPLFLLYMLVMFVPALAVQVRRLHDLDKSGWLLLLGFIPFIGVFVLLYFMCIEGTRGPNRYGQDPRTDATIFSA
ncbi:Uncharacterized membrane protein YhaH, DUF805 family [Sphingomonas laterariae]|uniref:Uncharacterized membrane protein YhaH, DUF805 family n=1 Tax=Edaphosphingomonas laterariae TaxID=861865 RepID=A0A239CCA1_9SPHN|nr:DUF805 domain-containing protein [Sphingomonas laterariae]SNS17599.1 Uncharacterized membrane protein YhaH, DUF805 family [Sphingomonas laterariae]